MAEISIIIPCYNAESYIERCVRALEHQTFSDFTVIFVDDCSVDNTVATLELIKKNSFLDIVILNNQVNKGPAASRNKGISYCTSKYITFCDCDDWYESNFIAEMYQMLKKDNSDIVFCGYNVVDENHNIQKRPIMDKDCRLETKAALILDSDSLCMMMVKTNIMKETLLPDIRNGEDMAVVPLLIAKSCRCSVTEKCLYNYYRRSDSASQTPTMKVVDSICRSFDYTKKNFMDGYESELEYIGIKNMLYPSVITAFSVGYKKKEITHILCEFEKDHPNWIKNPYFDNLSRYKRVVLKLLHTRSYLLVRVIAVLRSKMQH